MSLREEGLCFATLAQVRPVRKAARQAPPKRMVAVHMAMATKLTQDTVPMTRPHSMNNRYGVTMDGFVW
jgi:hypothetical protein